MIITLIVFRVHYVIDVIGGVLYAGFVYVVVERNLEFFDRGVNFPYEMCRFLVKGIRRIWNIVGDKYNNTSLYDI